MEQRTNTFILVESLNSKMAVNMAANKLKYVYLNSKVSYKEKWGVDFAEFEVRESISCSGNRLEMKMSKMASNMAAKTLKYVYHSSQVIYKKN